uniref:Peptidase A1 domain-containing protein n=2 Tax=Bursaphelenchus xylophilus TaxID=6326 RepID=A0A1I7SJB5_BURXY
MLGFKVVVIGVLLASQCSSNIFLEFSGGVGYPPRVALTINNQRLDFALNSASALLWVYDHCSLLREVECKKFCEN